MVIDREAAVYRIARSSRAMTTLDVVTPLLQLSQQDIAAGDLDLAGRRLEIDLLALEDVVGGLDLRTFGRHHAKFCFGQLVANLDGHRQFSLTVRRVLRAFFC